MVAKCSAKTDFMNNELNSGIFVKRIGIIGEGKMGSGIFNYLLDYDLELVWVCSSMADTDKLNRQFAKRIRRSLDAGMLTQKQFEGLQNTIISADSGDLNDCDLIVEAIPEHLDLKKSLFQRLDQHVKQEAIFASNSSSINPGLIMPAGPRTRKFVGIHFFYPVSLINIAELTISSETSADTEAAAASFLNHIQRRYITLDEQNSFILNRIFLDVQNEAALIVESGECSYRQMDDLVIKHLFPFGIFDFCDSVGLDTMLFSVINYTHHYTNKSNYSGFIGTLSDLVLQGRLGQKSLSGFYNYPIPEIAVEMPVNGDKIIGRLRKKWLSASLHFSELANLPKEEINQAIREYFDLTEGPFG
jgi:3-hydroxybutyryl-CoA dehydrogenase